LKEAREATSVTQIHFGVPVVVKSACKHKVLSNEFVLQGRKEGITMTKPSISIVFFLPHSFVALHDWTKILNIAIVNKTKTQKMSEHFATH
jgi:hypothetical protein